MTAKKIIEDSLQKIKDLYTYIAEIKKNPVAETMLCDGKGRYCPISIINDIDLARNTLVNSRNDRALELSKLIEQFRLFP